MAERIRVGILGAGGRMGQAIIAQITASPDLVLAGGVERAGHPACGQPLGQGKVICTNVAPLARAADVLVDFTSPAALDENLRAAVEGSAAIVVGTTGLEAAHHAAIDRAARSIAILQAANTSLGVTLLARLVAEATAALGPDWDVEIVEMHHRHKVDAPSGTALALGEAAAKGRGQPLAALRTALRDGVTGARRAGSIGFASLRGGSVAGDHSVILAADGERIELTHRAESREIFARGAVTAARWLARKPPGRYAMADVFG
ncbi:4-hydroxy-tetrahydrodipicolinate reductase [Sandaracinobacteroides saxicola]|uniref:4-hydroxy-tetrahydrodipicolinate reductase n=1 Tax=Sandaracinobacteroides saxicola TaxID=2759707 RepID=A0A7G5IHJ3_9SPHN|nr:4-hydroxy-tetrahydrodipicolinate reductase [Sandaracinobacteroides saxicola]QMW22835.1 4-hydroxy-tetrahydrodipicolinate reductase [Sandaracinobacteroides saxicola]